MPVLLLLFLGLPLAEIYVLIQVGSAIGALWTILICVGTAVVGGGLLRYQGFQTLRRAQNNMQQGQIPAMEMFEGVGLGVGGALLLTPGLVTDTVGFLCLIPWTRRALVAAALKRMDIRYGSAVGGARGGPGHAERDEHETLEGEFHRRD